jgi:phosphatidylinositol alpha-mannosyltransferase
MTADTPTILFLGRLDPRKGLDVLLAAIPVVRRLAAEAGELAPRFIIAGDGPRRAEYHDRMLKAPDVIFTGALSEDQKRAYLAQADIFCAPSLGGESQGIVLLEALAAGATVVASDIPGYRSVISPEHTGLLTAPGDAPALAHALIRVVRDRALRVRLAISGYQAARRYDWRRVGAMIEAVYHQASAANAAPVAGAATKVYDYATELV